MRAPLIKQHVLHLHVHTCMYLNLLLSVGNALETACASHTCSQVCGLANDGVSRQCFCNPGYELALDDVTCNGNPCIHSHTCRPTFTCDCERAHKGGCLFQTSTSAQQAPTPAAPTVNATTLRAAMTAAVTSATCFRATRGRVCVSSGHMHFVRYHVNFVSSFGSTNRFLYGGCWCFRIH